MKLTIALLAAIVFGAANLAGIWALSIFRNPFNDHPFSATDWAKLDGQERGRMAGDLVKNHLKTGMSQADMHVLLGTPDDVFSASDRDRERNVGEQTEKYRIGSWSEYGYDDAFVYVHFDDHRNVISAEIYGY